MTIIFTFMRHDRGRGDTQKEMMNDDAINKEGLFHFSVALKKKS